MVHELFLSVTFFFFFGMKLPFSVPEMSWGDSNVRTPCGGVLVGPQPASGRARCESPGLPSSVMRTIFVAFLFLSATHEMGFP